MKPDLLASLASLAATAIGTGLVVAAFTGAPVVAAWAAPGAGLLVAGVLGILADALGPRGPRRR